MKKRTLTGGQNGKAKRALTPNLARVLFTLVSLRGARAALPTRALIADSIGCSVSTVNRKLARLRAKRVVRGRGRNTRVASWVVNDVNSAEFCLLLLDYASTLGAAEIVRAGGVSAQHYLPSALRDRRLSFDGQASNRQRAVLTLLRRLERLRLVESWSAEGREMMVGGAALGKLETYFEVLLREYEARRLLGTPGTKRVRPVEFSRIPA